jgi:hypothetical protein
MKSSPLFVCSLLVSITCVLITGCEQNPFPEEHPDYAVSFIIDRSGSYQDQLGGTAFTHFSRVKDSLFRDLGGSEGLVIVSQISGDGNVAVMFEGSPRSFAQQFPSKESFQTFINKTPPRSSPVFNSIAETTERLCRRHEDNSRLRSILLIYSDMGDTHGGKDEMDASVKKYASFPSAIGVYGANESWADYFKQLGIRHCVAYDAKRVDPPLPELP